MAKTTFKELLDAKVKEAQIKETKLQEEALTELLDNKNFIETQRAITEKEKELKMINKVMHQLNNITPYVAKDGRKFSIKVFAVSTFDIGLGAIIGIISGSRGAFVDEKMMEYSAISGITTIELQEASIALGSPAYYKDGKVMDATYGDYMKLVEILKGIFIKMGLHELKVSGITREKYDLWFALAETRANRQLHEHEALQDLEANAEDFVMED